MINLTKKVIPVLLLLFFAAQVYAEDVGLDKIIVTGTRVDENLENAPQSVSIIKRKDIETGTAQNLLDVIREDTGVTVTEYSSGNSKLASVDIRGFGETGISNSLVLIDGRRTNSMDLSGTDWAQIPLEEVERIEIIRGAGSVFYGDNASGGVINIITREPKEKAKVEAKSEAGSYATYNQMLEASGRSGKFKFLAFGKYYQSAGYRNNNDITSNDFLCKVGNKATDSLNLKLTLGYHRDAYGLPGALDDDQLNSTAIGKRGSVTPLDDAKTLDYFGDFNIENDFRECGKLETGVNMRVRQVKSNYMSTDSPWESDNYITTFGMTPKYQITHAIGDRENKITLGFDYSDAQDHIRSGVPNSENNVIIISRKSYGIYCLDQFFIL
ncbi:MAG: TonB-dependent receptor plug domain-containing protein, partial [Candidatus Omnitrophica bacterium]|nr:TonB-dependent receptor plug domain-containing protein [Candidatus Omnitrophota bacterium]